MSIEDNLYEQIRKLSAQKMSTRAIARELGCSRHTAAKYRDGACQPERKQETAPRQAPLRDAIYPRLKYYLELNEELPRKQKMSGNTIWLHLTREGFVVGESTVRHWIAQMKKKSQRAFVPLEFLPGEVMQVDWGEAFFYLKGDKTHAHCFCVYLPYSAAAFVAAFPRETLECFLHGHQQAFAFFGGVTSQCVYDYAAEMIMGDGHRKPPLWSFLVEKERNNVSGIFGRNSDRRRLCVPDVPEGIHCRLVKEAPGHALAAIVELLAKHKHEHHVWILLLSHGKW